MIVTVASLSYYDLNTALQMPSIRKCGSCS